MAEQDGESSDSLAHNMCNFLVLAARANFRMTIHVFDGRAPTRAANSGARKQAFGRACFNRESRLRGESRRWNLWHRLRKASAWLPCKTAKQAPPTKDPIWQDPVVRSSRLELDEMTTVAPVNCVHPQ